MEIRGKDLDSGQEDGHLLNSHPYTALNYSPIPGPAGKSEEEGQPQPNIQTKYYQEFKKIYLTSYKLWREISKQAHLKGELTAKISQLEHQLSTLHKQKRPQPPEKQPEQQTGNNKKGGSKRTRRTAEEIQRKYYCRADFCDRCYGSEGSLQQHIKLKHPQIYRNHSDSGQF